MADPPGPNVVPGGALGLRDLLPHGAGLPDDVWPARHKAIVRLVLLHAVGLFAFGWWQGVALATCLIEAGLVAALGGLAAWPALTRRANASAAALALGVSTIVLAHFSGGRSEAQYHAFLVVAIVALYQEWTPFLLAILAVAAGLLGAAVLDPTLVHDHPDAVAHPWRWGLVQIVALLAEAAALAVLWTGLEHLRNRTAVVLDSAGEAVLGLNRTGTVTFANPAAGRLLGCRPDQLTGRDVRALMRPLPIELRGDGSPVQRGTLRTAGGQLAVEWTVSPKRRDGDTIGWVVVVRDVTVRLDLERQLEERSRQQAAVAQLGHEALRAGRLDGFLQRVATDVADVLQASHCKVLELSPDRRTLLLRAGVGWRAGLVGTHRFPADAGSQAGFTLRQDSPVVVEDLAAETRFRGAQLLQEHKIRSGMSVLIKTREGPFGVLGVHSTGLRRFSPDDIHFLQAVANLLATAIERHQAEQELRGHRASLEEQVAARTAALTEANRELEAFSYTVSHDLRSPLRSIDGFSRILLRRHGDELPEDSRQLLQMLSAGAIRMGNLIESVLSLARITRAQLRDEPLDLSSMAQEVLAGLRARDPGRRVTWAIEPGLVARGDPDLVRLALDNLLGNAWKFTSRVDPARITVRRVHGAGVPVFAVGDNGAGFDMAHAKELFQPFHRLHEPSQFEGTGIGLATVSRAVRRHGGHVWARAEAGRGATFYFSLQPTHEPPEMLEASATLGPAPDLEPAPPHLVVR